MKLNNRGMSIVEVVVTFSLIMVIIISMLTIIMNYIDKANLSLKKYELNAFKDTVTKDIQNDVLKLGVKDINTEGECQILTDLESCINIVFQNDTAKAFGISKLDKTNRKTIENKYIYYGGIKYELKDKLPATIPEERDILEFQSIDIDGSSIISKDTIKLSDGSFSDIYAIDVYISHIDFEEDFGIHIITTNLNKSEITFKDIILADNDVVTDSPNLGLSTTDKTETGLFTSTITDSGKPTYYFRGDVQNNYLKFAGFNWRIVRINEDNTVRLAYFGADGSSYYGTGIESYVFSPYDPNDSSVASYLLISYFSHSAVQNKLIDWYNQNLLKFSDRIASGKYFCEAMVTNPQSNINGFKCNNDENGRGLVDSIIGLISVTEVKYAGYYYSHSVCGNSSWSKGSCWTTSPASRAHVWYSDSGSCIPKYDRYTVPVINLKTDVTVLSGDGTKDNPYVIK